MADIAAALREKCDDYVRAKAEEVHMEAQAQAPVGKTGNLQKGIILRKNRDSNYSVVSTVKYTKYVHDGHLTRGANAGDAADIAATLEKLGQGDQINQVPANPFLQRAADAMKG